MLKENLNDYLNRKDLSKKALDEIIAILDRNNYSSNETVEELVECLFSLKSDVIYAFVSKSLKKVPDEYLGLFMEVCQKAINPNKFTHAFGLAIALFKQAEVKESNVIITFLVKNYILVKKANKQIVASFERAMHYDGAECFFIKWNNEDERIKNGYRNLLIEFLKAYPKFEYAEKVTKWFNVNGITIHNSEQEVIAVALKSLNGESTNEKEVTNTPVSAKKNGSVDLAKIPLAQLLEAVNDRSLQLYKKIEELETENKELKKNDGLLSGKIKSDELSLKAAENTLTSLREKIVAHERTIRDLNKNLSVANNEIKRLNNVIDDINSKLKNVESAYGHAGQQEIDFLKGQIKKRLATGYSKYVELKEKAPDLDYYVILLDMLDEVYHVLSKNGIKFD